MAGSSGTEMLYTYVVLANGRAGNPFRVVRRNGVGVRSVVYWR